MTTLVALRCPYCKRKMVEASAGAVIRMTCPRCKSPVERVAG